MTLTFDWTHQEKIVKEQSHRTKELLEEFMQALNSVAQDQELKQRLNASEVDFDSFLFYAKNFATESSRYKTILKNKAIKSSAEGSVLETLKLMNPFLTDVISIVKKIPELSRNPNLDQQEIIATDLKNLQKDIDKMSNKACQFSKSWEGAFQLFVGGLVTILAFIFPSPVLGFLGGLSTTMGLNNLFNTPDAKLEHVQKSHSSFAKATTNLFKFAPKAPPVEVQQPQIQEPPVDPLAEDTKEPLYPTLSRTA